MKTYECAECGREITIKFEYVAVCDRYGNVFCDEACFCDFYTRYEMFDMKKDDFIDEEEEAEQ